MDAAGGSVGKRLVPIVAGLVVVVARPASIVQAAEAHHAAGRSIRHDAD